MRRRIARASVLAAPDFEIMEVAPLIFFEDGKCTRGMGGGLIRKANSGILSEAVYLVPCFRTLFVHPSRADSKEEPRNHGMHYP